MPFVENRDAQIHWTSMGRGPAVVLIMGLGCSLELWHRVAPKLAKRYRVLLIDNRGARKTRTGTAVVHRVQSMASDVAAVLHAAGETKAHVVGFSMGGMVAQQFAVDYPAQVRSLSLLGTHCGGMFAVQASAQVRHLLFNKSRDAPEKDMRAMRPHTYARSTSDALFEEDMALRLANHPTARGYQAQLYGLIGWSCWSDLPRLRCPTLVMHGLQDELIVPANGRILNERIAGSTLIELPNASHWLTTDDTASVITALKGHLGQYAGN